MAEERTLARPYAEAIFDLARAGDALQGWSRALETLALIVSNPDVAAVIGNPRVEDEQITAAILAIAGQNVDAAGANLVRLLVANRRLRLLPAIAAHYADLRADAEDRVEVEVTAARALDDSQQQRIAESLGRQLRRQVSLTCRSEAGLIGGAVIRAGDLIIDGSVRAHLARLAQALTT